MSSFEFHRQIPGSESVGGVTLLIEPRQDTSVVLVDGLTNDLKSEWTWVSEIIRSTLNEVAEKGLDGLKPVVGLTATLLDLHTHLINSRLWAYEKATERALLNAFRVVGLVELRPNPGTQ